MNGFRESRKDVLKFLESMFLIINGDDFNIDRDFQFISTTKNEQAMFTYSLDRYDICRHLRSLKVKNYFETVYDLLGNSEPRFWRVFGKMIYNTEFYIKSKVATIPSSDTNKNKVICISFHPSEEIMIYPYANER